jgi:LysM repeat protein
MAQQGYMNAQARSDQANANVGYAIGQGVGNISGAIQSEGYNKKMDALTAALTTPNASANPSANTGGSTGPGDWDIQIPGGMPSPETPTMKLPSGETVPIPGVPYGTPNSTTLTDINQNAAVVTPPGDYINGGVAGNGQPGGFYKGDNDPMYRHAGKMENHVVQEGENLYRIAAMYNGVSVEDIKEWNGLTTNTISPTQTLTIKYQ